MRTLLRLFLLLLLAACQNGKRDIRDYYYPTTELTEGLVYAYDLTSNDTTVADYWYLRAFPRDSGLFLASTNYDEHFQIGQIVREKLTNSGALARDYLVYEPDTSRGQVIPVNATLEAPALFPFQVSDSLGVFLFSLNYHPLSDPTAKQYLIRNRRFLGDGPDFEFQGKKYPTVRFGVREAIGNEKDGSAEIEGRGEEWYARGLGLVYFQKVYGPKGEFRRTYRLKERFPMEELERRAKSTLSR